MKKTEITSEELHKKVKKLKNKLMIGKAIATSMLIILVIIIIIFTILNSIGYTDTDSILIKIMAGIILVCFYPALYALIRLPYTIKLFKKIKEYEKNNILDEMVFDLETSEVVDFGDKAILSDKYLFTKNFKRLPIPCNEIYWLYTTIFNGYVSLKIGTKNHGIVSYSGVNADDRKFDEILNEASQELQKRVGKNLLLDYSEENKEKYRQIIK